MPLNFSEIRRNAEEQGVSLKEIAIVYENLTDDQAARLSERGLLAQNLGNGKCLGRFADDGHVLFPEMATAVMSLSAYTAA